MVEVNKKYQKKENNKVIVIPFEITDGNVNFSHEGFCDWRVMDINLFLSKYEEIN